MIRLWRLITGDPNELLVEVNVSKNASSNDTKRSSIVGDEIQTIEKSITLLSSSLLTDVSFSKSVDHLFYIASAITFIVWVVLLVIIYNVTDPDEWRYVPENERLAAQLAMLVHIVAFSLQLSKMIFQHFSNSFIMQQRVPSTKRCSSFSSLKRGWGLNSMKHGNIPSPQTTSSYEFIGTGGSGILAAGCMVQFISLCTNIHIAYLPCVVLTDKITRTQTHLLRWCEWAPLAGLVTFMSEVLDLDSMRNERKNMNLHMVSQIKYRKDKVVSTTNDNKLQNIDNEIHREKMSLRRIILYCCTQSLSCCTGLVFPFCTNIYVWMFLMAFGIGTYSIIFYRVSLRRKLYKLALRKNEHLSLSTTMHTNNNAVQVDLQQRFKKERILTNDKNQSKSQTQERSVNEHHNRIQNTRTFVDKSTVLAMEQEVIWRRRFSFYLVSVSAFVWTLLIVLYAIDVFSHNVEYIVPATVLSGWREVLTNIKRALFLNNEEVTDRMFFGDSTAMILDTAVDVFAKILYVILFIDVYADVLEPKGRAKQQLLLLRSLASAICESSSDVIVISVKIREGKGKYILGLISPTFHELMGNNGTLSATKPTTNGHIESIPSSSKVLLIKMELVTEGCASSGVASSNYKIVAARYVDSSSIVLPSSDETIQTLDALVSLDISDLIPKDSSISSITEEVDLTSHEIEVASNIIAKSWHMQQSACEVLKNETECLEAHSSFKWLIQNHVIVDNSGRKHTCDFKISKHDENILVSVVKDTSELQLTQEAEMLAHSKLIARQREASNAIRFTRHEVKNGLLAGIELCDDMRTSFMTIKDSLIKEMQEMAAGALHEHKQKINNSRLNEDRCKPNDNPKNDLPLKLNEQLLNDRLDVLLQESIEEQISELRKMLQNVLKATLSDAIKRDIVHDIYEPNFERVRVQEMFTMPEIDNEFLFTHHRNFPVLIFDKDKMPDLLLDRELVDCIHRNAVANACKYGKLGGTVETKVSYDPITSFLQVQVTNEIGIGHEELLNMSDTEADRIFQQGVKLNTTKIVKDVEFSEGDDCFPTTMDRESTGDGAWIMQKCAVVLGGSCRIKFSPDQTVFTFSCPVKTAVDKD